MIFVAIAMLLVYLHVRKQEAETTRTLFSNASSNKSQSVARQGILYIAAFWLTWIFGTMNRAYQTATKGESLFPLLILHSTFIPSQGFFNFLVYIRPRYLNYRALHPEEKVLGAMTGVLQGMFCCYPRRSLSSPASDPRANAPRAQTRAGLPGKENLIHINAGKRQQAAREVQAQANASRLLRLTTTDTQGTVDSYTESNRGSSVDLRAVIEQQRSGDEATPAADEASPAASPRASTQLAQA
jgi:hypothetical protein